MKISTFQQFVLSAFKELGQTVERAFKHTDKKFSELQDEFSKKMEEQSDVFSKLLAEQCVKNSSAIQSAKDTLTEQVNELSSKARAYEVKLEEIRLAAAEIRKSFVDGIAENNSDVNAQLVELEVRLTELIGQANAAIKTSIEPIEKTVEGIKIQMAEVGVELRGAVNVANSASSAAADASLAAERSAELAQAADNIARLASEAVSSIRVPEPQDLSGFAKKSDLDGLATAVDLATVSTVAHSALDSVKTLSHSMPLPFNPAPLKEMIENLRSEIASGISEIQVLASGKVGTEDLAAVRMEIANVSNSLKEYASSLPAPFDPSGIESSMADIVKQVNDICEGYAPAATLAAAKTELMAKLSELAGALETQRGAIVENAAKLKELADKPDPVYEPTDLSGVYQRIAEFEASLGALRDRPLPPFVDEEQVSKMIDTATGSVKVLIPAPVDLSGVHAQVDGLKLMLNTLKENMGEALLQVGTEIEKRATPEMVAEAVSSIRIPEPVIDHSVDIEVAPVDFSFSEDGSELIAKFMFNGQEKSCSVKVPSFNYEGIWAVDKDYSLGQTVTHEGSLWLAKTDKPGRPGIDTLGWKLIVKGGAKGRDGKDGRSIKSYGFHEDGNTYYKGDFLNLHGRIWQCNVDKTSNPPEGAQVKSDDRWNLVGYTM